MVAHTGTFYSAEVVVFRSFVWMADHWASAGAWAVARRLWALAELSLRHAAAMAAPALVVIAVTPMLLPSAWRSLPGV